MRPELTLHPQTETELKRLAAALPHAVILEGPVGIGKYSVALQVAAEITDGMVPLKALQQVLVIDRGKDTTVAVEKIRDIERFLSRKLPGDKRRMVIIDDAHTMRQEAQNALLKTLEEPPAGTTIVLLTANQTDLLPTVRSRSVILPIKRPQPEQLKQYFTDRGHAATDVDRALLMSGGLPGLMHALLTDEAEHPLKAAAITARQIIQASKFERLVLADKLSKQREQAIAVCDILGQMAHIKLAAGSTANPWPKLLTESYTAGQQLRFNTQPKLVLTNLMLSL